MSKTIRVAMASYGVAKKPDLLDTLALGSCVGIVLYDMTAGIAGMAHAMLPDSTKAREKSKKEIGKFVDTAITKLVKEMVGLGVTQKKIRAKLAGGANMFPDIPREGSHIGLQNVMAARAMLKELKIPLDSEATGGSFGRTIIFDTMSGVLTVKTMATKETNI